MHSDSNGQTTSVNRPDASAFLGRLWSSKDGCHFFSTLNNGSFRNVPATGSIPSQIAGLAQPDTDLYFAPAAFHRSDNRTAANATGSRAFWMDIDCGEAKAGSGQGYKHPPEARQKLEEFCREAGLPLPSIIVISGSGLHVYWVLNEVISTERWKDAAIKLKALTKRLKFLADPSRTADIASVMRVPGTLNYKDDPPKPVELLYSEESSLDSKAFLQRINEAISTHDQTPEIAPVADESQPEVDVTDIDMEYPAPAMGNDARQEFDLNLPRLKSALAVLNPDCSEFEWKFYRIAALANTAQQYPESEADLFQLACEFSSGKLAGKPAVKWTKPAGKAGKAGKDIIVAVWKRFFRERRSDNKTTAGTIYHAARQAGWEYDDDDGFQE